MNFNPCKFEKLAFLFLWNRFGRDAQVEKSSLLEVNLLRRKRRRWAYECYLFGTLQALGSHQPPRYLEKDERFFTMRSKDSETTHLLGSGPVLRHNNAFVRDVLTAPSNVNRNLALNLSHSNL